MVSANPPGPDEIALVIAASDEMLAREPAQLAAARQTMHLLRIKLARDRAPDASLVMLCRYIARLDAHLRRGSEACLHLVPNHIE